MAFSTLRGRQPRPRLDDNDHGTPELQFKRALGITAEPIDICLERKLISADQHWCGLHLRWLYTLRYGAPVVTTRYADKDASYGMTEDAPEWRSLREREYHAAIAELKRHARYEPVMRICVFNELPSFLHRPLIQQGLQNPSLAGELEKAYIRLVEGLDLLIIQWRPRAIPTQSRIISSENLSKRSQQNRL
jgi:hypothetical protein